MIFEISTIEKAKEIMRDAHLHPGMFLSFVFDLDESLDPNDVPCSISQCVECGETVHFDLGDDNTGECPKCSQRMEEQVAVILVIQGAVVISTTWRQP